MTRVRYLGPLLLSSVFASYLQDVGLLHPDCADFGVPDDKWSEFSECDTQCGSGYQWSSGVDGDGVTHHCPSLQGCVVTDGCSNTNGCSELELNEYVSSELVEDDFRLSCSGNTCQAYCVDEFQKPNGKVFYQGTELRDWDATQGSLITTTWDGVFTCVTSRDECGIYSFGTGLDSSTASPFIFDGTWCGPRKNQRIREIFQEPEFYSCVDMPCVGFGEWAEETGPEKSDEEMSWQCHQGTCFASCPEGSEPRIQIGSKDYPAPFLNCHETPMFIYALHENEPYGEVSFVCSEGVPDTGQWSNWGDCGCNERSCLCNETGTRARKRNVNGQIETETGSCVKECTHDCAVTNGESARSPPLCTNGLTQSPGFLDANGDPVEASYETVCDSDDAAKRNFVCTNDNECRWRCVDRPNDPFYDPVMWSWFPYPDTAKPEPVRVERHPYFTGDQLCAADNSWWPYYGDLNEEVASLFWDGVADDAVKPNSTFFGECRTFWCFPDKEPVTINDIMNDLYDPLEMYFTCDRGVCTANCNDTTTMPYVTYAGRTYRQSKFSCLHRSMLEDFRKIDRSAADFERPLICGGPPEEPHGTPPDDEDKACPDLSSLADYNVVVSKLQIADQVYNTDGVLEDVYFECSDSSQVVVDGVTYEELDTKLTCGEAEPNKWDESKWLKLVDSKCVDLPCSTTFTELNGYGNTADDRIDCSAGTCTVNCGDKFAFPSSITCENVDKQNKVTCHASPCGPNPYATNDEEFDYNCQNELGDQAAICQLSCDSGQVANTKVWRCDLTTNTWENTYNHILESRPLKCIDDVDTPCGNVVNAVNLGKNTEYDCPTWISIYEEEAYECEFSCSAENYELNNGHGKHLICEGNSTHQIWTDLNSKPSVSCDSVCPELSTLTSFDIVDAKLKEVSRKTENDILTIEWACKDDDQVITDTGTNKQMNAELSCQGEPLEWNSAKWNDLVNSECRDLPCKNDFDESTGYDELPEGATLSCSGGSCTVTCIARHPYPATIDCSNVNDQDSIECRELECTTVENVLSKWGSTESEFTIDCTGGDECSIKCTDSNEPASPQTLKCDGDFTPQAKPVCPEKTECGFSTQWNYGPQFDQVQMLCSNEVCNLSCEDDRFPFPVDQIKCENKILYPCEIGSNPEDPTAGMEISCQISPCGDIEQFGFDSSEMTASCDENSCSFSCVNATQIPNTKTIYCDSASREWINQFEMDQGTKPLECIDPIDTPCGNLDVDDDMTIACSSFDSIFDQNEFVCQVLCKNGLFVNGPETFTCENGAYTPAERPQCCERVCCGLDKLNGFDEIVKKFDEVWDSDNQVSTFTCKDPNQVIADIQTGEVMFDTRVECDIYSQQWDIARFNELKSAECRDLPCSEDLFGIDIVQTLNGASFKCSDGECTVECPAALPFPFPSVVNCKNLLSVIIEGSVTCKLTPCGNPDDFYSNAGWSEVVVNCDDDSGVCDLTCPTNSFIYPVDQVMCLDGQLHPAPGSIDIYCGVTKCGGFNHFGFDETEMKVQCDTDGCSLSCLESDVVPNTKEFACHPFAEQFLNPHDMDPVNRPLQCIPDQDTPCGDVDTVANLNPGVEYTCDEWVSVYDDSPHEHYCLLSCQDPDEQIYGVVSVLTCKSGSFEQSNLDIKCWNPDNDDTVCGNINSLYTDVNVNVAWECSDIECTPVCAEGEPNQPSVVVTCDPLSGKYDKDASFTLSCELTEPDECGSIETAFFLGDDVVTDCNYDDLSVNQDSTCSLTCPESFYPTYVDEVKCVSGKWNTSPGLIKCGTTKCGDQSEWNFGIEFDEINVSCDFQTDKSVCNLQCEVEPGKPGLIIDLNHNTFTEVVCQSDRQLLPAAGSVALFCAETVCGKLSDFVSIHDEVIVDCTSSKCTFSCPLAGQIPTHEELECKDNQYQHYSQSESVLIQCVDEIDTPCGDLDDYFTVDWDSLMVSCDSFSSVHETAEINCSVNCKDKSFVQFGDDKLTCLNHSFTNKRQSLSCEPTPCGDPADHVVINSGVDYTCDKETCSFNCAQNNEISIIPNLVCNQQTKQFELQVLWEDTGLPLIVSEIVCHQPNDPTFCNDPLQYFTSFDASKAVFDCDWDSNVCEIKCNAGDMWRPTTDKVHCNPNTRTYIEEPDLVITCIERETPCGDVESFITYESDISPVCVKGASSSECVLECSQAELIPSPIDRVVCDHSTKEFSVEGDVQVALIECITPPETPCGYLKDFFSMDPDLTVTCHQTRCDFTCKNEFDFLELSTVFCHQDSTHYSPPGGEIKCKEGYDTACGNLIDQGFLIESTKDCSGNTCSFTCENNVVKGLTEAECHINPITKEKTWTFVYNLPTLVEEVLYSTCTDNMCGDLQVSLDKTVELDWHLDSDGFGSVSLECQADLVISGTGGKTELICSKDTGVWDLMSAEVTCSSTYCGDPDEALNLDQDVNWDCNNNICTFSCSSGKDPNLTQMLCDQNSGKWMIGSVTNVRCDSTCDDFGDTDDFILGPDVIKFCHEYEMGSGSRRCDLFCRDNSDFSPFINETGQILSSVICRPPPYAPTDGWMKLEFDAFGIPTQSAISGEGKRHLVCDEDMFKPIEEEKCRDIQDEYSISKKVIVKCSHQVCAFECSNELKLTTELDHVYCIGDKWLPVIEQIIDCVEVEKEDDGECGDGDSVLCHMCEPIESQVHIDENVIFECSDDHCLFGCIEENLSPTVEIAVCKNKKWDLENDANGVFCGDQKKKKKDKKNQKDKKDKKGKKNKNKNKKPIDQTDPDNNHDSDQTEEQENDDQSQEEYDQDKTEPLSTTKKPNTNSQYDEESDKKQKGCSSFTNFDKTSVKTKQCRKANCKFACLPGYENLNQGQTSCLDGEWQLDVDQVRCQRKNSGGGYG